MGDLYHPKSGVDIDSEEFEADRSFFLELGAIYCGNHLDAVAIPLSPNEEIEEAHSACSELFLNEGFINGEMSHEKLRPIISALSSQDWKARISSAIDSILSEYRSFPLCNQDPFWIEDQLFYELEDLRCL